MRARDRWADLAPRVISGVIMAVAGIACIWAGGWVFQVLAICLCGIMLWETARMFDADGGAALQVGLLAAAAFAAATLLPYLLVLPVLLAAAFAGAARVGRQKRLFAPFAAWVMLAGYAIWMLRYEAGLTWIMWLVLVVVVTDVAGYFAGRYFGGAKFWPQVSPKKTWSGTAAGWIGAALVGLAFAAPTGAGLVLVPVSVIVSFAGQMGDIAESVVKRRTGVKDASHLIPGHGGVLDRLDAMLGAGMLVLILWAMRALPGLT